MFFRTLDFGRDVFVGLSRFCCVTTTTLQIRGCSRDQLQTERRGTRHRSMYSLTFFTDEAVPLENECTCYGIRLSQTFSIRRWQIHYNHP